MLSNGSTSPFSLQPWTDFSNTWIISISKIREPTVLPRLLLSCSVSKSSRVGHLHWGQVFSKRLRKIAMARSSITNKSRLPSDSTSIWAMSLWFNRSKKPAKQSIRGNLREDLIATIMIMRDIYSRKQRNITGQKQRNGVPQLATTMCLKYKRHWRRRKRMLIFGMIPKPSLKSLQLFSRNALRTTPLESSRWAKVARWCSRRDTQRSLN